MDSRPIAAIVGGHSLAGREIRDLLKDAGIPTRLIGADQNEAGLLTEDAGEPVVLTELDAGNLAGSAVVFLAGSPESSRRALEIAHRMPHRVPVVDLTYTLDDRPGAFLRAPAAEPAYFAVPSAGEHVVAHPAAIVLALLLPRMNQAAPIRRAVVQLFEPASERGKAGIEELQVQTVSLLTFKELPRGVYDSQVAFNLLARYGPEARQSLEAVEVRIEKHLATLLGLHQNVPMPSLRLVHAPVFHGYSASVWVEFENPPAVPALEAALACSQIDVRGPDLDPPDTVGMAGQGGIAVGAITPDRNHSRACWLWVASDNIRVHAENAVAVARGLLAHGSAGAVQ